MNAIPLVTLVEWHLLYVNKFFGICHSERSEESLYNAVFKSNGHLVCLRNQ